MVSAACGSAVAWPNAKKLKCFRCELCHLCACLSFQDRAEKLCICFSQLVLHRVYPVELGHGISAECSEILDVDAFFREQDEDNLRVNVTRAFKMTFWEVLNGFRGFGSRGFDPCLLVMRPRSMKQHAVALQA